MLAVSSTGSSLALNADWHAGETNPLQAGIKLLRPSTTRMSSATSFRTAVLLKLGLPVTSLPKMATCLSAKMHFLKWSAAFFVNFLSEFATGTRSNPATTAKPVAL